MERLTFDGKFCDIAQCRETPGGSFCENGTCSQKEVWLRLKDYEDTGLTPGEIKSLQEEHFSGLELAKLHSALKELKKYQEADKEGRVAVLPCEVGGSMLNMVDIERPGIMKGLHFAVAYESVRGIIFYQPYDIFRENVDAGHIQPLSIEGGTKWLIGT